MSAEGRTRRTAMPRLRSAACLLVGLGLVLSPMQPAEATAQVAERIRIDGRERMLHAEPLEPFLAALNERPAYLRAVSSANWRGYVATWAIEDGWLSLHALTRDEDAPSPHAIPLRRLFGEQRAPIRATWFTGELKIPVGTMVRYVHRGFDSFFERELLITVVKGRVTRRRTIDNRTTGRATSRADRKWVARAAKPPKDDTAWHDARAIASPAFQKRVPKGKAFRTRGVFWPTTEESRAALYVPATPSTKSVYLPIVAMPEFEPPRRRTHVAIRARWTDLPEMPELEVVAIEALKPGQTIHHPAFRPPPWDDYEEDGLPPRPTREHLLAMSSELSPSSDYERYVDQIVRLYGRVLQGPPCTLYGVDIAPVQGALRHLEAVGQLQKWVITRRMLASKDERYAAFRTRGPGTYWRLVDPNTERLAVAKPVDD